jgi:DnaK suppressor protein
MRHILLRRRDALRRSLAGELRRFNTSEERFVGDAVDEALDTDYGSVNSQLAETESRELAAIQNALDRMQLGEYGVCEGCGRSIPVARLQALPYATTCVTCQRNSESPQSKAGALGDWSRIRDEPVEELTLDNVEFA